MEPQATALAEPDESGAALVDELLSELDAGRTGPLAEFVRAYVRRAPPPLRAEYTVPELAAQVRDVFAFADAREPGALARYPQDEIHESAEFLSWLTDDNFIYLGYREYQLVEMDGEQAASIIPGSGLGIMSDDSRSSF